MSKRRFSTQVQASKMGLRTTKLQNIDTLSPDFGLSESKRFDLRRFRHKELEIKNPTNNTEMIDLAQTLEIAYNQLEELDESEDSLETSKNFRASLLTLLVSGTVYIREKIPVELAPEVIGHHTSVVRLDTEIFILILRVSLGIREESDYTQTVVNNFPYIFKNRLINGTLVNKKVFEYTIAEVSDAFKFLATRWHELKWDKSIPRWIDLLLKRLASLHFEPQLKKYATGNTIFEEEDESGLFIIKYEILREIGFTCRAMMKKIFIYNWVNRLYKEIEDKPLPFFSEHDKQLLLKNFITIDSEDDLQLPFLKFCLNYIMMPGETDNYLFKKPHKLLRADHVMRKREGYSDILNRQLETLSLPVRNLIDNPDMFGHCVSELAMCFLMSHYMGSIIGIEFSNEFVRFYAWMDDIYHDLALQLSAKRDPVILQAFNWFGLYYRGHFFDHKSLLDATLHWILIVCKDPFNYRIQNASILPLRLSQYEFYRMYVL